MAIKNKHTFEDNSLSSSLDYEKISNDESVENKINKKIKDKKSREPVTDAYNGNIDDLKTKLDRKTIIANELSDPALEEYELELQERVKLTDKSVNLYDDAVKEIRPNLQSASKKVEKLLDKGVKIVQKQKGNKKDNFLSGDKNNKSSTENEGQDVNSAARDFIENRIRESIENERFNTTTRLLTNISEKSSNLLSFNNDVFIKYQKKSLELQYRSYFVQSDLLSTVRKLFEVTESQNEAIIKNTALPEAVKVRKAEAFKQQMLYRTIDSFQESLTGGMNIGGKVGKKLNKFFENLKGGLTPNDSSGRVSGQAPELSPLLKFLDQGLKNVTSLIPGLDPVDLATTAGDYANGPAKNIVNKLNDLSVKLSDKIRTSSLIRNSSAASGGFLGVNNLRSSVANSISGNLRSYTDDYERSNIEGTGGLASLKNEAKYNSRTDKTIVEIIPGYLSRILKELNITRTGVVDDNLITYDQTKNKFITKKDLTSSIKAKFKQDIKASGHKENVDKTYDSIFGSMGITDPKQQRELKKALLNLTEDTSVMDYDAESILGSSAYTDLRSRNATLADKFETGIKAKTKKLNSTTGALENDSGGISDLTGSMRKIKMSRPDLYKELDLMIKAGYSESLISEGILSVDDAGKYKLNEEKFKKLLTANLVTSDKNAKKDIKDYFTSKITSDVETKGNIKKFIPSGKKALDGIMKTNISNWKYKKGEGDGKEHIGPMAQDVKKNLGDAAAPGGVKLDLINMNGIAMAAIQDLQHKVEGGLGNNENVNKILEDIKLNTATAAIGLTNKVQDEFNDKTEKVKDKYEDLKAKIKDRPKKVQDAILAIERIKDIYVKGSKNIALQANKIKNSEYVDKLTGATIKGYKDITGPVIDKLGNIILDVKDISKGLVDYYGNDIKTGIKNVFNKSKDITKEGLDVIKGVADHYGIKDNISGDKLDDKKDLISKVLKNPIFKHLHKNISNTYNNVKKEKTPRSKLKKFFNSAGENWNSDVEWLSENKPIRSTLGFVNKMIPKKLKSVAKGVGLAAGTMGAPLVLGAAAPFIGKKLFNKGKEYLEEKKKDKPAFNDKDNSGERDGSWKDRLKAEDDREKERSKNKPQEADLKLRYKDEGKGLLDGFIGKLGGLFKGLFGKIGSLTSLLSGGKIGSLLSGAKGLLGRGLGGMAARAAALPGLGALASGAGGLITSTGALASSGLAAAGGALAGIGGGSAMVGLGTVLAAPIAVGAVAYGGYKLYKYIKNKITDFDTIRFYQYGLTNEENHKNHYNEILELEKYLLDGKIMCTKNGVEIIKDKLKTEEVLSIFNIDKKDNETINKFTDWFHNRFKPFFFKHIYAVNEIKKTSNVFIVDGLKDEEKQKYLDSVQYDSGPYFVTSSPFKDIGKLNTVSELAINFIKSLKEKGRQLDEKRDSYISRFTKFVNTYDPLKPDEGNIDKKAKEVQEAKSGGLFASLKDKASGVFSKVGNFFSGYKNILSSEPKGEDGDYKGDGGSTPTSENSKGVMGEGGNPPNVSSGEVSSIPMAGGSIKEGTNALKYIRFSKGTDKARLEKMNPTFLKAILGAIEEYGEKTGKNVTINSSFRSYAEQEKLFRTKPKGMAAAPGKSLHEFGLAIDIHGADMDAMEKTGVLKKYGITRPIGREDWHAEASGIQGHISEVKKDPALASQLVAASFGRGGGGIGSMKNYTAKGRNDSIASRIFNSAKSIVVKLPELAEEKINTAKANISEAFGKAEDAVSSTASSISSGATEAFNGAKESINSGMGAIKDGVGSGVASAVSAGKGVSDSVSNMLSSPDAESKSSEGGGSPGKPVKVVGGKEGIKQIIAEGARKVGMDPKMMQTMAAIESDLRPDVGASGSSGKGLFQFLKGTWKDMMSKYANKFGIAPGTSPNDPLAASIMGAQFAKDNAVKLKKVKPNPDATSIYTAHFLGPDGARKAYSALNSNPNALGTQVFPRESKVSGNRSLFFSKSGQPLSIQGFFQAIDSKLSKKAAEYGIGLPSGVSGSVSSMADSAATGSTVDSSSGSSVGGGEVSSGGEASSVAAPAVAGGVFAGLDMSKYLGTPSSRLEQPYLNGLPGTENKTPTTSIEPLTATTPSTVKPTEITTPKEIKPFSAPISTLPGQYTGSKQIDSGQGTSSVEITKSVSTISNTLLESLNVQKEMLKAIRDLKNVSNINKEQPKNDEEMKSTQAHVVRSSGKELPKPAIDLRRKAS